jgi:hypothetical protein
MAALATDQRAAQAIAGKSGKKWYRVSSIDYVNFH